MVGIEACGWRGHRKAPGAVKAGFPQEFVGFTAAGVKINRGKTGHAAARPPAPERTTRDATYDHLRAQVDAEPGRGVDAEDPYWTL